MASTTETSSTTTEPPGPTSPRRGRGGRGRGGPRNLQDGGHEYTPRGRGRGGYRGRGRGSLDGGVQSNRSADKAPVRNTEASETGILPHNYDDDLLRSTNTKTKPCTEPKVENAVPTTAPPATDEPEDGEVCFICASPIQHTAVTPCNHRTCHICALRLRALYKVKTCAHCRTECDYVIFTDSPTKNFEEFSDSDFFKSLDNLGIHFENKESFTDTELLLRYNCPDADCDVACLGWPDLHRHVQTAHNKKMW
jgi:E3 ubiquitin-protein ligase ZNF598